MKNWIKNNTRSKPVGFSTHLESNIYVLVILLGLLLMFNNGCSLTPETDIRDMEEFEPLYKECDKYIEVDNDAWMTCIMDRKPTPSPLPTTYRVWSDVG